jgi:hypothetical protein
MPSIACLLAQYSVRRALPTCPIRDETLMMDPGSRAATRLLTTCLAT